MRRVFTLLLSAAMLLTLASCGGKTDTPPDTQPTEHVHNWTNATCLTPRFCPECGEIEGESLGHDFLPATTDAPATCSRCGYTVGEPLVSSSFSDENGVFSIRIEDGVLIINGEGPMEDCYDDYNVVPWYTSRFLINEVVVGDGITTIGTHAFNHCWGLESITIPDSVTTIGSNAFFQCSRLESITIPDSVTKIEAYAFHQCSNLTSITIPDRVEKMGAGVFDSCTSLEDIFVESGNPYYKSIDGVLFDRSMTSLCAYPAGKTAEEYVIPDGVTQIWDSAFASCGHLTSITIPDSVTLIGNNAFSDCTALTSLTIPSGVTTISSNAFNGCISLKTITIPSSVEKLYKYIFSDCTRLTDIYYEGTAEEWAELLGNVKISGKVTIHYEHTA